MSLTGAMFLINAFLGAELTIQPVAAKMKQRSNRPLLTRASASLSGDDCRVPSANLVLERRGLQMEGRLSSLSISGGLSPRPITDSLPVQICSRRYHDSSG